MYANSINEHVLNPETMTIDRGRTTVTIYHRLLMRALEFQTLGCVIRKPLPPLNREAGSAVLQTSSPVF